MKIDAIELYHVAMPLVYPFRTAFADADSIESVLVKLVSGDHVGCVEATPWQYPAYSPEFAAGVFLLSNTVLAPRLLGQEIGSGEELQSRLSWIKGNQFAKSGFDMAWWDLEAHIQGVPLWQLIGGTGPEIEAGADFGIMESFELLVETMEQAVAAGYERVKLKYRPGWELDMLDAVRERFPDLPIHVDCNSAYTLDNLEMLKQLDRYNLVMIEQPLSNDDLIDHAALQAQIKTPICLDESINSIAKARKAIAAKACGWINIKPGRVGGLTNAIAINSLAADAGIPCWIGGMLESSIGGHHCVALATLPNIKYPNDIFPTDRFFSQDLSMPAMIHSAPARFRAQDAPGIATVPDPDMLDKMTLAKASHR